MICSPSIFFFIEFNYLKKECVKRGKNKRTYIISEGWRCKRKTNHRILNNLPIVHSNNDLS